MRAHLAASMIVTVWVLLTLLRLASAATKPIALTVSPRIAVGTKDLAILIRVHASPEDRWISVATDSGEFARKSEWSIEPDRTLYPVTWRSVPVGEYDIVAMLGHGSIVTGQDRLSVQLVSIGP